MVVAAAEERGLSVKGNRDLTISAMRCRLLKRKTLRGL